MPVAGWRGSIAATRLKKFFPYYRHLWEVKGVFTWGVVAGLVYAVATGAGLPLMTKVVFPILFNEGDKNGASEWYLNWITGLVGNITPNQLLIYTCLWIPVIFAIRGVASFANSYLITLAGTRVIEMIRTDLFVKLQTLPLSFFKRNSSGDLLARVMNDTQMLRQVVAQASSDLIKQPATLISALGFIIYLSITDEKFFIAVIALLTVPVCVFLIRMAGKKLARRAKSLQSRGGDLSASLSESLQSALEIRAFNLQKSQTENFTGASERSSG